MASESLDALIGTETTTSLQIPDPAATPADEVFDRHWAPAVMDRALKALEGEFGTEGKSEHFELLQPWLVGTAAASSADAAQRLGMSEGAL